MKLKKSLKLWRCFNLSVAALSMAALTLPSAPSQAQRNTPQTTNPGDQNRIQQQVQLCGRLERDLAALGIEIDPSNLQNATVTGERNRIQQQIKVCCGKQADAATVAEQLQNTEQTATIEGDRNRVRQRIRLCNQ